MVDSNSSASSESSESTGLDDEDLRAIEDELFDLEDELIEMQGTTIRTYEQTEDSREVEQIYSFQKPEESSPPQDPPSGDIDSTEELVSQIESFQKSIRQTREVRPGQLLAADLRGQRPQFQAGLYTVSTPRAERIFAGRMGQVVWKDDTVHVLPLKRVDGDVDSETGDIRYDGSVLVEGNVEDNREIEATGTVWVLGSVGHSDLKASGDIVIQNGIKGTKGNRVTAQGNLYARFIENASVSAGKNLITEEAIMHSRVEAEENIFLVGEQGFLVGGQANAGRMIYAQEIGSKNSPDTVIRMGAAGALQERLSSLRDRREELSEQESQYSKDVDNLLQRKEEEELSPKDEERLRNYQFELNHVRQDLQEVSSKIKQVQEKLNAEQSREVHVRGTIHPGVVLQIASAEKEINEEKTKCSVQVKDGEIKFESFHEPSVELDLKTRIDPDESDMREIHEVPPLDQLRRHLLYREDREMYDREQQLKRLLGLEGDQDLVLLDVTESEEEVGQVPANGDRPDQDTEASDDDQEPHVWWAIEVRPGEDKRDVQLHFEAKRRDSVKVRCDTPREGVEKAAEYFDVEPGELAVQILEEGRSGVLGIGQKKYLIRAKRRSAIKREQEEDPLEDGDLLSGDEQEDVAGFINLENADDGLKLAVYPPEGHGLPVTVEDVEEELEEQGYDQNIDWVKVENVVDEAAGEPRVIGPRQRDPEIDGSFNVEVNDSETKAYLTVLPPRPEGMPVRQKDVREYLEEEGIQYDESVLREIFEEDRFEEKILVAEGSEPVHGEDAHLDIKVDLEPEDFGLETDEDEEDTPEEDSTGSVDHRTGKDVISVRKNELLVEVKPATQGEPGMTIYGDEIPCEAGGSRDLKAGENVRKSGDGTQYIAEVDGRVLAGDGKISVEPVFVVEGDLDYETGNVTFDGVVVVKGRILDGFRVEAGERVEAESAGKCTIRSKGEVVLQHGMAGKGEGLIESEGDVFAKFLENTQVRSGGSVRVDQTIMHSDVDAEEYVLVRGGRKGNIIGGRTRAGKGIEAQNLGSAMAPKTEVLVGIKPRIRDRIEELEEEIETQKGKFEKVRLGLKGINKRVDQAGGLENLTEEQQDQHSRLSNVAQAIKHKIEGLHGELEDLRTQVQSSKGGEVCVAEDVHDGTKITIQTSTLHITNTTQHARFILHNGEVVQRDYEELDLELEEPETVT